jgi:hypothetical protein
LGEISIALDGKDRDFFLTTAVNAKRGFYLDAWIPTLQSFLEVLEDKIYVVDA